MQHFGDPAKQPLDQDDLMQRIREMEQLSRLIEPELDHPQNPDFKYWVLRYQLVGVEVKRLLIHAEEVLPDTDLIQLKLRLDTEIQPVALNRFEKYRFTSYATAHGL
jgi:hypothetical protein